MTTARHLRSLLPRRRREGPDRFDPVKHAASFHCAQERQDTGAGAQAIYCAQCRLPLTSTAEIARIDNRHSHVVCNPAGLVFSVCCFHRVPGALAVGEKSGVFSWFAGFVWQVALCRGCRRQLGWFFSGAGTFYALITERFID